MLSILGSHCGGGAAPSPPPFSAFIYIPSIYASMHASIPARHYYRPSIQPPIKLASNQQTKQPKPHNPVFSPNAVDTWFALRGRRCTLPRAPSRLYLHSTHPSIHPSIHPSNTNTNNVCPSSTVSRKQSRQANQQTNAPKSNLFSLSMIHPSLCVFYKSKQPTAKQAEPTNTPTKGSGVKRERVATKLCFPQMLSILALHW